MRKICFAILILITQNIFAQSQSDSTTSEFKITGKVKADKIVSLTDLKNYPAVELTDVNISCSPRKEDRVKQVKAVLLKNILDSAAFQYEKPRMLNQYYFLFVASDGYKVVFSFNEIYNTEIGKNLYVVTEIEGKKLKEMNNSILILTTKDIKSGSRNMKWLSKIVVCSAE